MMCQYLKENYMFSTHTVSSEGDEGTGGVTLEMHYYSYYHYKSSERVFLCTWYFLGHYFQRLSVARTYRHGNESL